MPWRRCALALSVGLGGLGVLPASADSLRGSAKYDDVWARFVSGLTTKAPEPPLLRAPRPPQRRAPSAAAPGASPPRVASTPAPERPPTQLPKATFPLQAQQGLKHTEREERHAADAEKAATLQAADAKRAQAQVAATESRIRAELAHSRAIEVKQAQVAEQTAEQQVAVAQRLEMQAKAAMMRAKGMSKALKGNENQVVAAEARAMAELVQARAIEQNMREREATAAMAVKVAEAKEVAVDHRVAQLRTMEKSLEQQAALTMQRSDAQAARMMQKLETVEKANDQMMRQVRDVEARTRTRQEVWAILDWLAIAACLLCSLLFAVLLGPFRSLKGLYARRCLSEPLLSRAITAREDAEGIVNGTCSAGPSIFFIDTPQSKLITPKESARTTPASTPATSPRTMAGAAKTVDRVPRLLLSAQGA